MKARSMKALSLAVMGLAGLGFAGASMAQCPTDPAQPIGPWSGKTVFGGTLTITAPGLNSTACTANMAYNTGAGGLSASVVRDDTPAAETRYRLRFYMNPDALTGFSGLQGTQIFTANAAAAFPAAGGSVQVLRMGLIPGGATGKQVSIIAACNNAGSGYICPGTSAPLLAAGSNVIEAEVVIGATGTGKVNYWVNNSTAASPTGTVNVDNAGWVGIDTAFLGLSNATTSFRTAQATRIVKFDEFDSRRQTFIGP